MSYWEESIESEDIRHLEKQVKLLKQMCRHLLFAIQEWDSNNHTDKADEVYYKLIGLEVDE